LCARISIEKLLKSNNPAGMQSKKRSRCQALQSGSHGKHVQTSLFTSSKIHAEIWLQLVNQADNAAFGDFGLHCRFCAALRLIRTLVLRSVQAEVISFVAK
jgi:hypothetical protein